MLRARHLLIAALVVPFGSAMALAGAPPEPGTSVELPYLIAPMFDGDNLYGYAYISSKVIASSPSAAIEVREKTGFIQDAFVRDVNATSVTTPQNSAVVDAPSLKARMLADVKRVVGGSKAKGFEIIDIKIRVLGTPVTTATDSP